jgi:hypothetical protein
MVRRIEAGEALEQLGTEVFKPEDGGERHRFRACKDGAEGWITTQGSQGTIYAKSASRHYIVQSATPVHAGLAADSAVSRTLKPGEAFQAFEEPKEVSGGDRLSYHFVRAVADGAEGWVAAGLQKEVTAWTPTFSVLKSVPLTKSLPANEAAEVQEIIRHLREGEIVEFTEQPVIDASTGLLRARLVAQSDGSTGWATVRGEGSSLELLNMSPATEEQIQEGQGKRRKVEVSGESADAPAAPTEAPAAKRPWAPPVRVKQEAAWRVKREMPEHLQDPASKRLKGN